MANILVVDDDGAYRDSMTEYLRVKGHQAVSSAEPLAAEAVKNKFDLVLLDIMLAELNGLDVLDEYCAAGISVAIVSGATDVAGAVRAIKAGALDVMEKPVDTRRLEIVLAMADRRAIAARGDAALRDAWLNEHLLADRDSRMAGLVAAAERAARTSLSILLHGPSGSGKEPLARWIHYRSLSASGPFVAVNCAAIPPELAESELFGHRKGAFTGAERDRPGCFREASGGTLFLDEVGELLPAIQAKLLRAIETGEIRAVGADASATVKVRIVSATNRDLKAECAAGRFREDLLYRLGQIPLAVPPLSDRREDIPLLAAFFARQLAGTGGSAPVFDSAALGYLREREYPGNVRELKSLVERAIALSPGPTISAQELKTLDSQGWTALRQPAAEAPAALFDFSQSLPLREAKRRMELVYLEQQVKQAGSVVSAAQRLGILANNLSRRLAELSGR